MALDPIRLGSAALSTLVFETGSQITTSDSGIQSCSVKALCGDGQNIFSNLPAAGTPFSSVFGNNYIPSNFLVDYTDSGPQVEYLEGRIARVTFSFKRQDPTQVNVRKIFVDSTLNYTSVLSPYFAYQIAASGETQGGVFGFPEPVVTVKYNSTSQPGIGSGGLSAIYALPGSTNASGFPAVPTISVPYVRVFSAGAVLTYFNGTNYVSAGPLGTQTTFTWNLNFVPNARGWQLIKLKSDPLAAASFWDVEEQWRNFYFFNSVTLLSVVPPIPP